MRSLLLAAYCGPSSPASPGGTRQEFRYFLWLLIELQFGRKLIRDPVLLKPAYRALYALHYAVKYALMRLTAYLYFEPVVRSRCAAAGKNLQLWKLPRLRGQPEICLGNNVNIYGEWFVESNGQSGDSTLVIGDRVEIGHRVLFMVNGGVVIEEYANIAGGTTIGAEISTQPVLSPAIQRASRLASAPVSGLAAALLSREA